MKRIKPILNTLLVSALFTLGACSTSPDKIHEAENVIEQYPDSTLSLLYSISRPNLLSEENRHLYNILETRAKDKLYMDITKDTVIFEAAKYFVRKKNNLRAAESSYYSGRIYHEQHLYKEALDAYLEASKYAELLPEGYNLKGVIQTNIGYILYRESDYGEALISLKKAFEYFYQDKSIDNEISIQTDIGNCYTMLGEKDSAYIFYNQSLALADSTNLPHVKLRALQNLAVIYQVQNNNTGATELYRRALPLATDSITKAKIYLSLTKVYQREKSDSLNYYFEQASNIGNGTQDPYFATSIHNLSSSINESKGNYKEALSDYKTYNSNIESLFNEREKKTILEIQKKYQYEIVKNQNNELYIKYIRFLVISLTLLLIIITISFIFYYHLQKRKILLEEADNKILNLNNLALSYNEKRNSFRDTLLHHFDILRKSAVLQMYMRKDEIKQGEKLLKKFNDIVYKQEYLDWGMLYDTMNELHYGFLDELKKLVPDLDESEFRICCLIYSDFNNQEIGIIMKLSSSTITHRRSSIRKKMGLEEYGNIYEKLKLLSQNPQD